MSEASRQLTSAVIPIGAVAPERVLEQGAGTPRGFWGSGESWSAWWGVAGRVDGRGASSRSEAFERIRRRAAELLTIPEGSQDDGELPRLHGGFSFDAADRTAAGWDGFPGACFILPAFEVRSDPEGTRLIAWTSADAAGEGGAPEAGARAAELAERAAAAIAEGGGGEGGQESALAAALAAGPGAGLESGLESGLEREREARERWRAAVGAALEAIGSGELEKVVLARTLDVRSALPLDPLRVLARMRAENGGAHVFLFEPAPGRVFLGAAPELLASLDGGRFHATAVAGSIGRGEDDEGDRALARRLRGSGKDLDEHRVVVEDIARRLEPFARDVIFDPEPRLLRLARIQHLETRLAAEVEPHQHVLSFVEALHPTPAVCGHPRAAALRLIEEAEPFERGWYAGPVGWFDAAGNGTFAPALRSAVGGGRDWRLFAGAGIVQGSDPDREWEETCIKLQPMLRALGAESER